MGELERGYTATTRKVKMAAKGIRGRTERAWTAATRSSCKATGRRVLADARLESPCLGVGNGEVSVPTLLTGGGSDPATVWNEEK
jgi:hypothetical protein